MNPNEFESRFFIDAHRMNCPFCYVRSIGFIVTNCISFDWSVSKKAYAYFIKCLGCNNISMHFSYSDFGFDFRNAENTFSTPPSKRVYIDSFFKTVYFSPQQEKIELSVYENGEVQLDDYFFYHHPSSAFSIDPNVPVKIKKLILEAEGCKKQNFLVGASGALRKAIYEFLLDQNVTGTNYEEKIKSLKEKYPKAQEQVFDALVGVQDLTSNALHEDELGNWEPWQSKDFNYVLEVVKAVMYEVYTAPYKSQGWLDKINQMKSKAQNRKN